MSSIIECINPFNNPVKHYFFRHVPKDPRFNENDKAKICPVCWSEAQLNNSKLYGNIASMGANTKSYINHLTESKPEKDTL